MNDERKTIQRSDTPVFVRLREFLRLVEDDRLVTLHGKHFLQIGQELRPVHVRWHRSY